MLTLVVTNPDLRIRAVLAEKPRLGWTRGVSVKAAPDPSACRGPMSLQAGDQVFEIAGRTIFSFVDFSRSLLALRNARLEPGARLYAGADPTELSNTSTLSLVEMDEGERFAKVRFWRNGEALPLETWVQLQSIPESRLAVSLIWLVLQLIVCGVSAVAYWNRPSDRAARAFFALSSVTMVALLGGNHWWVVAGTPWLSVPFTVAATLLPAVLLHFALVYPRPKSFMALWPQMMRVAVYSLAALAAAVLVGLILGVWLLSSPQTQTGPFAAAVHGVQGEVAMAVLRSMRVIIYGYVAIAAGYFALALLAFLHSSFRTRNTLERRQVQWLLVAAVLASFFVAYTIYLAFYQRVDFALGSGQIPMFLACLAFMLAYAFGIVRYRLMLIDHVIRQGLLYHAVSGGILLLYSLVIAVGCVVALRQELSAFEQMVSVVAVLMLTIVVLEVLRDRVQRAIERAFFREKYRLNATLQEMNRAVADHMDRKSLADHFLSSCCDVLGVNRAAVYLRPTERGPFALITQVGQPSFPAEFAIDAGMARLFQRGNSLQRVRAGQSPSQRAMREVGAALVHGLDVDGQLLGLLVFAAKPSEAPYSAEDVGFLTAVGRTAGFALHFAKVHDEFGQLTAELTSKINQVAERDRQIALLERQLSAQSGVPREREGEEFHAAGMVGRSAAIREVLETVRKVAVSDSSVLIRGESGTGKELLARAIHENSPRRGAPLVSLHCAALSPTLLESELFGHVRGAFTDAREDKVGRIQMAHTGTLFLDEIGDISLDVQVKLLRVLQQRTFEPVGSNRTVHVNVRVVAATHRKLEQLIRDGTFREDLYFRLNVISVTLPPLRERRDDILDLAFHFLAKANERCSKSVSRIDDSAAEILMRYDWPGNIRELENVLERAVVLAESDRITPADLPPDIVSPPPLPRHVVETKSTTGSTTRPLLAHQMTDARQSRLNGAQERQLLAAALREADGNKAEAARLLGLPRSTFYSKLKKHALS